MSFVLWSYLAEPGNWLPFTMITSRLYLGAALALFFFVATRILRLFKLRNYPSAPGPALAKYTNWWYLWEISKGKFQYWDIDQHAKYGTQPSSPPPSGSPSHSPPTERRRERGTAVDTVLTRPRDPCRSQHVQHRRSRCYQADIRNLLADDQRRVVLGMGRPERAQPLLRARPPDPRGTAQRGGQPLRHDVHQVLRALRRRLCGGAAEHLRSLRRRGDDH